MLDISREEFVEKANKISKGNYFSYQEAVEYLGMQPSKEYKKSYSRYYSPNEAEKTQLKKFLSQFLIESVYTGGYTGGNCWDDTDPYFESSGDKVEFAVLDKFLAEVAPSITFLKYKGISELIKENERTEYEYYGNTSDYKIFYIDLNELYDYLSDEA